MKELRNKAKDLRKKSTDTENYLWRYLRDRQIEGFKFRRQQPIGKYIVDFVSFEKNIIIEVDGGQHLNKRRDKVRDEWLKREGYKVLRFWDNEVLTNTEGVLDVIIRNLLTPHPPTHATRMGAPLPQWARGIKYLFIIVLILLCGCGSALRVYLHPQTDISGIKKVAVIPFSNLSSDHFAGERFTNAFITELLIRINVEIVEEGELVKGLKEIGLEPASGVNLEKSLDVAKLQKLGKSLGAQGIVMGSVDQYDMVRIGSESYPVITLTVRLLDVETGGIMWMSSCSKKGGPGSIPFVSAGEIYTLSELTQKVARQIVSSLGE